MPLTDDKTRFCKELRVSDPECDVHNRLRLSDVLRHMQEISGEHLDALGMPYEMLYEMGQVFLLSKLWLDIVRRPASGEILRWSTKPLPPVGAQFVRCNDVVDARGETVLHADSLWMLVNPHTRSILRPSAFEGTLPLSGKFEREQMKRFRVELPADLEPCGTREVFYSDLDVNRHMNNAIYADLVCDYLPDEVLETREPSALFLHFQSEATLHTPLSLSRAQLKEKNVNNWFVSAEKPDGKCFEAILQTVPRDV